MSSSCSHGPYFLIFVIQALCTQNITQVDATLGRSLLQWRDSSVQLRIHQHMIISVVVYSQTQCY